MKSHSLDSSLPCVTAEQSILQHIFEAQCFQTLSSMMSHCCIIQHNFQYNPRNFIAQVYNITLHSNPSFEQLASYCQALGMQQHELKMCSDEALYIKYILNCCHGHGWTADSVTNIQCIHSMKFNEVLVLCRIHSMPVMNKDTSWPLLMSIMITSLLCHFLLQPCSVVFNPFHPGQTHCITHSPFTAAHAESHTCTLKAIVQLRTSHKLTMQFLDTIQIQYSLLLTLNVL